MINLGRAGRCVRTKADEGRPTLGTALRSKLARLTILPAMLIPTATVSAASPPPATDYVLRLVGRFGAGHACAVAPRVAWTAAHVTDMRPFDREVPAFPVAYSDGLGNDGYLIPKSIENARDIAAMQPLGADFVRWLPIAKEAPKPGDRLYLLGYSWRSKRSVLADDVIEARLTRIVARHLVFVPAGHPGSSGSCVLNEAGEVVGINTGAFDSEMRGDEAGLAVGVWGEEPK